MRKKIHADVSLYGQTSVCRSVSGADECCELVKSPKMKTTLLKNTMRPYRSAFVMIILLQISSSSRCSPPGMPEQVPQTQRWFEDITHRAGIRSRHHTRRFN